MLLNAIVRPFPQKTFAFYQCLPPFERIFLLCPGRLLLSSPLRVFCLEILALRPPQNVFLSRMISGFPFFLLPPPRLKGMHDDDLKEMALMSNFAIVLVNHLACYVKFPFCCSIEDFSHMSNAR